MAFTVEIISRENPGIFLPFRLEAFFFPFAIYTKGYRGQSIQHSNFFALFHGCEAWSLTVTKESKVTVLWSVVLGKVLVFGTMRNEAAGDWRKLRESLQGLYSS
jgi:hypothetical protein